MFSSRNHSGEDVGVGGYGELYPGRTHACTAVPDIMPGTGREEGILFRCPHIPSLNYLLLSASPPKARSLPATEPAGTVGTLCVCTNV